MHWMCHLSRVGSALCCVCVETEVRTAHGYCTLQTVVTVIPPQPLLRLWNLLYKTRGLSRAHVHPPPPTRASACICQPVPPGRACDATCPVASRLLARRRRRLSLRRRRRRPPRPPPPPPSTLCASPPPPLSAHTIAAAAGARDDGAHKPSAKAAPRFTFATCGFDWSSSGEIKRDAGGASETQEVRATGRTQMGSGGRAPA